MLLKNLILLLLIKITSAIPSNAYYLIDIDTNSSLNTSYCSNILINKDLYQIPRQCHKHLLCDPHHCDDKSFRCTKIRETLCCLYKYIRKHCQKANFKDQFRSIYFHISIQHGYCEINLERIEQNDHSYCLANHHDLTTTHSPRLSLKSFHRRLTKPTSSNASVIYTNLIIVNIFVLFFSTFC